MEFDVSMFNFDSMKEAVGVDPFAAKANKFEEDTRFYKLAKDKEGNGGALIRFLPDSEKGMMKTVYKINTTIEKNGKKRFVSEFSPTTIGKPCPFQEEWQRLWNLGDKVNSKFYGRSTKYLANIKVIKDPANPENEGKIFLLEMSGSLKDKIQNAVDPSVQDRSLGKQPKEMFNPLRGNSFMLVAKRGANAQINYDSSEVVNDITSVYESVEAALADIQNNTHKLSDFDKETGYLSYEKLQEKMKYVTFDGDAAGAQPAVAQVAAVQAVQAVAPELREASAVLSQPQTTQAQPASGDADLSALLNGLV